MAKRRGEIYILLPDSQKNMDDLMLLNPLEIHEFMTRKAEVEKLYTAKEREANSETDKQFFANFNVVRRQIDEALTDRFHFQRQIIEDGFVKKCREDLSSLIKEDVDSENLFDIHFKLALLFRFISIAADKSYSNYPIVKYYLYPETALIPRWRIDEVTYGVSANVFKRSVEAQAKAINDKYEVVSSWDAKIEAIEKRVAAAALKYEGHLDEVNYLGLANAFSALISAKRWEANKLLSVMILLVIATLTLPVLHFSYARYSQVDAGISISAVGTMLYAAILGVLLLYYFRIVYQRWSNVKSQLLQLELRRSMCAFVQDYAEKSKDLDRGTLAKFENMIFTEVAGDPSAPPSVYDAVDSIAKAVAAWKRP